MALHFILGGTGRGKTYALTHTITKMAEEQKERLFVILVPEQATMQMQQEMVALSAHHGIMNIEVQSFVRLAYRIFEETGTANLPVLDDMGKTMVLHKVLLEQEEALEYFGKNVHKKGYVAQIKSFLSEMMQYGVEEEEIDEMIACAQGKTALQKKLQDMKTAYRAFRAYLKDHYITSEEVLSVLSAVVPQSTLLEDAVICLDGYTGFTPVQYQVIRELMKVCGEMYVTVTLEKGEALFRVGEKHTLFYLSRKTMSHFWDMVRESGLEEPEIQYVGEDVSRTRFAGSDALDHLERQLFRFPVKPYDGEQSDISIHVLRQPQDEIRFVAEHVLRLRQEGYRYRDIAVVAGDMEVYGALARVAFEELNIPCFIDQKKSILANPFVSMLDALLDVLQYNYKYECVIRYLRGRYSPLKEEETDLVDNYLLATGIRGGRKWHEEWNTEAVFPMHGEEEAEALHHDLNALRQRVADTFEQIDIEIRTGKHSVQEFATALVTFLERQQFFLRLEDDVERFRQQGELDAVREYGQIYQITLNVLDRLVELLGEERMLLKDFRALLDTGFSEARVGLIPPGVDQIVVGDLTRTRLGHVKHLFFLGATDANLPKSAGNGGILSSSERSFLEQEEFALAPTERERIYTEQFYLYLTLTKPQEHLYLCVCEAGNDGKEQKPSYLIDRVRRIYPALSLTLEERREDAVHVLGQDRGISYLIQGFRNKSYTDSKWMEIYRYYCMDPKRKKTLDMVMEAAFYHSPDAMLTKEAAHLLYQEVLRGSASRFEMYASCAYRFFLQYGLQLRERRERVVEFYDIGNIIHETLELYTKDIIEKKQRWQDVEEEEQRERVNRFLAQVTTHYKEGLLQDNSRSRHVAETIRRILYRTIRIISLQMNEGDFQTVGSELRFEQVHGPLRLLGSVDRVDCLEKVDRTFLSIVDYKTGNKELSLSDFYFGLQMQLVIYLQAAMDDANKKHHGNKKIIPAGIFYFHPEDPMLDRYVTPEMREKELMKLLRMEGLVNEADEVLYAVDENFRPEEGEGLGLAAARKSLVVPVATKTDGNLAMYSKKYIATDEEFSLLLEHAGAQLREMSQEILNGEISIRPYRKTDEITACGYCPYHAVCQFDPRLEGMEYRELTALKDEQVYAMLQEKYHKKDAGEGQDDGRDEMDK